jgi:tRNA(fMet)-specific endonuclease VapC
VAGWLIDTSVLVGVERGRGTLGQVPAEEEHAISAITASELLHGVHRAADGDRRTRRRAFVESVLAELETLPVTLEIARVHAEIWAQLQATGRVIGAHDLWISATAIAYDLRIATCNPGEFERVPGLAVLGV